MKGGDAQVNENAENRLFLANQNAAALQRDAANERLAAARSNPIRRSIGYSIIRIGERLAAEPNLRPARVP
jgi:hypothetical protein